MRSFLIRGEAFYINNMPTTMLPHFLLIYSRRLTRLLHSIHYSASPTHVHCMSILSQHDYPRPSV
jgi:hypothetical protein